MNQQLRGLRFHGINQFLAGEVTFQLTITITLAVDGGSVEQRFSAAFGQHDQIESERRINSIH